MCILFVSLSVFCCFSYLFFFFFKQKTAYEMRISDWSSDVFSSDLVTVHRSPVYLPRKFNAITRMLHYGSFALACLGPALRAAWANKPDLEIGRAACRERVCQYEYISACGVSLIKKIIT